MKQNQSGFGVAEIVIIIVLLAGIGGGAWYYFQRQSDIQRAAQEQKAEVTRKAEQEKDAKTPVVTEIADKRVNFTAPPLWEVVTKDGECKQPTSTDATCVASALAAPPEKEKLKNISGDAPGYFSVNVSSFLNVKNRTAKDWFLNEYAGGQPNTTDKVSDEKVNDYDTYYFRQVDAVSDQIYYTYAAKGRIVVVSAKVLERKFDATGQKERAKADFTKYVPQVESIAKSVIMR